jgi:hypothetical protein
MKYDFVWYLGSRQCCAFQPVAPGLPVMVAEWSKACTVFTRLEARTVGLNPSQGMDVWCLCMCVFFCVCVQVEALR